MSGLRKLLVLIPLAAVPAQQVVQPGHDQALFREIFGEKVCRFDAAAVAKLKTLPPGERLKWDTDGDGRADTAYFIDTDAKHDDRFRPVLVKAIDRDGDMERDGGPDLDSDLYIADLRGDGTVDSVVEYLDRDHDNALDEMAIYTYSANNRNLGTDAIQAWWSRDVGHDHRLWETVNYRYQQKECQFRCDFNGDEIFSNYVFNARTKRWEAGWENPFAFYDEDRDKLAEVVIRFSGKGNRIESMRYSFDADNDATRATQHDYDFGFTCLASRTGEDGRTLELPPALTETISLQGHPADPVLAWKHARRFGESAPWGRVLLSWVENNSNVDAHPDGDPHSRWEGVIASPAGSFPQVGGPPVGPYNVRYETDLDNSGRMQLYYSASDRRIHLRGADEAWLKVDYNFDGKLDYEVRYMDSDGDGLIDTWKTDVDGDGRYDRTVHLNPRTKPVPLVYNRLTAQYRALLKEAVRDNEITITALKAALQKKAGATFREDAVETYFRASLSQYRGAEGVGRRIHDSAEGVRFYQDLIRERYFASLMRTMADEAGLRGKLEKAYNDGDYRRLAELLKSVR